uniref:Uncharacterized protein n=1 Tax=Rhizophora mucronata TaxID=61149 RepID=A0A2P2QF00_RHIMU
MILLVLILIHQSFINVKHINFHIVITDIY